MRVVDSGLVAEPNADGVGDSAESDRVPGEVGDAVCEGVPSSVVVGGRVLVGDRVGDCPDGECVALGGGVAVCGTVSLDV